MIRRVLGFGAAVLAALGIAGTAVGEAPSGPRLTFARVVEKPLAIELVMSDAAGRRVEKIMGGGLRKRPLPSPFGTVAWSPDGSLLAFSGWPRAIWPERRVRRIYLVGPDGSGLRGVPGTEGGVSPVFSPDGKTIAFAKIVNRLFESGPHGGRLAWKGATMWSVGVDGLDVRQLTPWRNGVEDFPTSFSPDGSVLAFSHMKILGDRIDAMALRMDRSEARLLVKHANRPIYSPDGSRIAYLGVRPNKDRYCCLGGVETLFTEASTDLYSMKSDGSGVRRLTDTPETVELAPSWDPGGERLVYSQIHQNFWEPAISAFEGDVMEINADGTCRTRILKSRDSVLYGAAVWQPGPGREAGRIEC